MVIDHLFCRLWVVENGIKDQTCKDHYEDDNVFSCQDLYIPHCADRTINCTEAPTPAGADITFVSSPDPANPKMAGTEISFVCPKPQHGFDYPNGPNFVSYNYEKLFNSLTVYCTNDRYTLQHVISIN